MNLKNNTTLLILLLVTILMFSNVVGAENDVVFEQPTMITSIGQSPDALMIKVLLERNQIDYGYKPLAGTGDLDGYKNVIFAVGASSKGMGAAGIDFASELDRTKRLLAYTEENNIPSILVHVGGKSRRGGNTDELLELVAKKADMIIITSDGNEDGFFTEKAEEHDIPLKAAEKISETGSLFAETFN